MAQTHTQEEASHIFERPYQRRQVCLLTVVTDIPGDRMAQAGQSLVVQKYNRPVSTINFEQQKMA